MEVNFVSPECRLVRNAGLSGMPVKYFMSRIVFYNNFQIQEEPNWHAVLKLNQILTEGRKYNRMEPKIPGIERSFMNPILRFMGRFGPSDSNQNHSIEQGGIENGDFHIFSSRTQNAVVWICRLRFGFNEGKETFCSRSRNQVQANVKANPDLNLSDFGLGVMAQTNVTAVQHGSRAAILIEPFSHWSSSFRRGCSLFA